MKKSKHAALVYKAYLSFLSLVFLDLVFFGFLEVTHHYFWSKDGTSIGLLFSLLLAIGMMVLLVLQIVALFKAISAERPVQNKKKPNDPKPNKPGFQSVRNKDKDVKINIGGDKTPQEQLLASMLFQGWQKEAVKSSKVFANFNLFSLLRTLSLAVVLIIFQGSDKIAAPLFLVISLAYFVFFTIAVLMTIKRALKKQSMHENPKVLALQILVELAKLGLSVPLLFLSFDSDNTKYSSGKKASLQIMYIAFMLAVMITSVLVLIAQMVFVFFKAKSRKQGYVVNHQVDSDELRMSRLEMAEEESVSRINRKKVSSEKSSGSGGYF